MATFNPRLSSSLAIDRPMTVKCQLESGRDEIEHASGANNDGVKGH